MYLLVSRVLFPVNVQETRFPQRWRHRIGCAEPRGSEARREGHFKGLEVKSLKTSLKVWKSENEVGPIVGLFRRQARRE